MSLANIPTVLPVMRAVHKLDLSLWEREAAEQRRTIGQALTPQPGSAEEARLLEYYATAGRYTGD